LGTWLEQTGDRTGASAAYASALSIDSKFAPAGVATARMKMLDGRGEEAREDLNRVLAANPRNVNALLALGMLEEASGHRDGAIEAYRRILGIDPEHVVAKNNLSLQLVENPATSDEALLLAQTLAQAASENAEIADTVGWVYYKKGLYTPAVRLLERAAAGSRDARTKYHLAIAYYAAGQPSQGRRVLAEARALNPNLPEAKLASEIADRTP
jgi:tetratricopeptide (TPR) repeat protein